MLSTCGKVTTVGGRICKNSGSLSATNGSGEGRTSDDSSGQDGAESSRCMTWSVPAESATNGMVGEMAGKSIETSVVLRAGTPDVNDEGASGRTGFNSTSTWRPESMVSLGSSSPVSPSCTTNELITGVMPTSAALRWPTVKSERLILTTQCACWPVLRKTKESSSKGGTGSATGVKEPDDKTGSPTAGISSSTSASTTGLRGGWGPTRRLASTTALNCNKTLSRYWSRTDWGEMVAAPLKNRLQMTKDPTNDPQSLCRIGLLTDASKP